MRILMVTAEAVPFVKTGGLADVLGALPPALARLGEEVAVVMPLYEGVILENSKRVWDEMPLVLGRYVFTAAIHQVVHQDARYFFVDCPALYGRRGVYNQGGVDFLDNHIRFAALNQAALGIARNIFRPDIFHGHDWPAGLLAPYLKETFKGDPTFFGAKVVMSIHNLGYQGNFPAAVLPELGLDSALYHSEGLEFWQHVSFLKAGIAWADAITTVSPTYAKEIQTAEFGHGMEGLLVQRADRICGILNGVDYAEWNPETDPHLPSPYSATMLAGKQFCKLALLAELGLPLHENRPLIGIVSRLAEQKGFDLLLAIATELMHEDLALVVLGNGDLRLEQFFTSLGHAYPDKAVARIGYDDGLAHRIEGAADMFLMPSRYEPCGLSQLYSLRYGTVPIVRATGGLADTVNEKTGFKFDAYTPDALLKAVRKALTAWKNQGAWQKRMKLGMAKNFSWDVSAAEYQKLYRGLTENPRR